VPTWSWTLSFLVEQIATIRLGDEQRTDELRHRYLTLIPDATLTDDDAARPAAQVARDQLALGGAAPNRPAR
jgi:hypothetical protein